MTPRIQFLGSNCHLVAARPAIGCAALRLAVRAPSLRAATAFTRPNRSAQRLPCGRYTVPTAMTIGPNNIVTNHCVERGDYLTHHRHDRYLRLLSGGLEAVMERLEPRIPITGTHRRHVEHLADVRTTAPDAPPSLERTALESIGSDADQRSDLLAGHAAELGQEHPTPGMDVSSRYRCASAASVATISTRRVSSNSMSAASLPIRRRERRRSNASSSSLEAFSAATFSELSWRRTASISATSSAAGVGRCAGRVGMMPTNDAIIRASSGSFFARTPLALANCRSLNGLTWRTGRPPASNARMTPRS